MIQRRDNKVEQGHGRHVPAVPAGGTGNLPDGPLRGAGAAPDGANEEDHAISQHPVERVHAQPRAAHRQHFTFKVLFFSFGPNT